MTPAAGASPLFLKTVKTLPEFGRSFLAVLASGVVVASLASVAVVLIFGRDPASRENGPIEILQLIALAGAILYFLLAAIRADGALRIVAVGSATLCVFFFFREFEATPEHPFLRYLASDSFLYHLAFVLIPANAIYVFLRREYLPEIFRWVFRGSIWPYVVAGAFGFLGETFEGWHRGSDAWVFWEEYMELIGYVVLLAVAHTLWLRSAYWRS